MPKAIVTPSGRDHGARRDLGSPALSHLAPPVLARVNRLSEDFWLDSAAVDAAAAVPASHLDALARAGLYGIYAPVGEDGLGLDGAATSAVVEELASGCVATTFLWVQHLRLLTTMLDPETPLSWRERLKGDVVAGRCKGGVVLTGLMPGPPRLRAEPAGDGWRLEGEAPWVSGWGLVDKLVVVARAPASRIVSLLLEAREVPGLSARPARLSALNATATVSLHFDGLVVPGDRALGERPYEDGEDASAGLRLNGSFALGLTKRCCLIVGPSALDEELVARRGQLDAAAPDDMPAARAAACELALRAAHAVVVSRGSVSALAGDVGERLAREASVLAVFGSRPAIKSELLARFHATPSGLAATKRVTAPEGGTYGNACTTNES
jgi:alkylation response protein AidB-like acyl-CoA dehydrogenase